MSSSFPPTITSFRPNKPAINGDKEIHTGPTRPPAGAPLIGSHHVLGLCRYSSSGSMSLTADIHSLVLVVSPLRKMFDSSFHVVVGRFRLLRARRPAASLRRLPDHTRHLGKRDRFRADAHFGGCH